MLFCSFLVGGRVQRRLNTISLQSPFSLHEVGLLFGIIRRDKCIEILPVVLIFLELSNLKQKIFLFGIFSGTRFEFVVGMT